MRASRLRLLRSQKVGQPMRLLTSAMCTATAVALLAGCSGPTSSTGSMSPVGTSGANKALGVNHGYAVKSLIPEGFRPLSYGVLHGIQALATALKGDLRVRAHEHLRLPGPQQEKTKPRDAPSRLPSPIRTTSTLTAPET